MSLVYWRVVQGWSSDVGKRMSDVVVLSDDRLQHVNHKDKRIWG
jgi:hypothetical protein